MGTVKSKSALEYAEIGDNENLHNILSLSFNSPMETSKGNETVLHWACFYEDEAAVVKLLGLGHGLNPLTKKGYTPLHCACSKGCLPIVKILLEAGARHDISDYNGVLPLHLALQNGFIDVSRCLLGAGADIEQADHFGDGCVHYACVGGCVASLKLLVEVLLDSSLNGLSLDTLANVCSKSGMAPLHFCASNSTVDCIDLLLQLDADLRSTDQDGNTVLHKCAHLNNHLLAEHVLRHHRETVHDPADDIVNIQNMHLNTALHIACYEGAVDTALVLIRFGALTHLLNKDGRSPLVCAKGTRVIRSLQTAAFDHDLYNWFCEEFPDYDETLVSSMVNALGQDAVFTRADFVSLTHEEVTDDYLGGLGISQTILRRRLKQLHVKYVR